MTDPKVEAIESGRVRIKSIHVNGKLTAEARKVVDKRFSEAQAALQPEIKNIRDSRRISADDLALRVVTRD